MRSAVLSLLHVDGPLSRAQLGDATRLNRSTIAGLVQELELLTHGGEAPPAVEEEEEDDRTDATLWEF